MKSASNKGFLARHGAALIDAGYDIVPIQRGKKFPPFDGWEKSRPDHDQLQDWLDNGLTYTNGEGKERTVNVANAGIGIIARHTPGVDLDIRDEDLAVEIQEWIHDNVGMAPVRVGQAPKRLLMFRTDAPFTKMASAIFLDDEGRKNQVEILGDGQQFVAFHIHPDTGKPYHWLFKDGPLVTDHDDLPTLTDDAAADIIDKFEELATARGWERKKKAAGKTGALVTSTRRDVFMEDTNKADISDEELHAALLMVPAQPDYDSWLQIGMALYHQYDGGERGLELWHEWSEIAYPDDYDAEEIDDKWERGKLKIDGKGRAPVTARLIIKLGREHADKIAIETVAEINRELSAAGSMAQLREVAEKIKHTEIDAPTREQIVGLLRDRFKVITNQTLGLRIARDMVRYENPEVRDTPRWLLDWVYLSNDDKFYNLRRQSLMTQTAFNSAHSRFMLTKKDVLEGRANPERLPSHVALNIHQIPVLGGRRYMPGLDEVFTMNGVQYANMYSDRNVPEVPDKMSKRDRRNIQRVIDHIKHLFPDEREGRILLDYMANIVQNPDKRPRWAVLLQGVEEDGKSFFGMMLGAVLGAENVRMLNAKTVQGDFNGWAEGQQVVFIEEIRLHGHNRFDVLNQVKPLITNSVIEIHRKGVDPYNVPNTSAYILATNYKDALPLTENDSRYFVMFSRFQTKAMLKAFKMSNPDYYSNLYKAIDESAGAIRGWLLDHDIGPEVRSSDRAPDSNAKGYMAMLAKSEEQLAVELALETSKRFDVSKVLLNATSLVAEIFDNNDSSTEVPKNKAISKLLSDMGFSFLGRIRVNGRYDRFWSMEPERFRNGSEILNEAIRDWATTDL